MSDHPLPERPNGAPPEPRVSEPEWITVGEIIGAFGLRGEVKVLPLTDFPERFERKGTIYIGSQYTPRSIENARQHKQMVILKLSGIDTITDAERLRGAQIYVPESEATPLPEDQFYVHDLIGLRVEHVNGHVLGTVTDYIAVGGNDLFVVRSADNGSEVMLPAVKEFVKSIDLAARVMRVEPIPGLFDTGADEAC